MTQLCGLLALVLLGMLPVGSLLYAASEPVQTPRVDRIDSMLLARLAPSLESTRAAPSRDVRPPDEGGSEPEPEPLNPARFFL